MPLMRVKPDAVDIFSPVLVASDMYQYVEYDGVDIYYGAGWSWDAAWPVAPFPNLVELDPQLVEETVSDINKWHGVIVRYSNDQQFRCVVVDGVLRIRAHNHLPPEIGGDGFYSDSQQSILAALARGRFMPVFPAAVAIEPEVLDAVNS